MLRARNIFDQQNIWNYQKDLADTHTSSVADPDPGSGICFFRIPDPKSIFLRA
jgi:hypothetical protein